jgi:hypothetical protein
MTAVNVVCSPRHRQVQVCTDAALYNAAGVVQAFASKVFAVPNWPGVVTGRGVGVAIPLLGTRLALLFQSFDEAVDGIVDALPEIVRGFDFAVDLELHICGWSEARQAPEHYIINCADHVGMNLSAAQEQEARNAGYLAGAFVLLKMPDAVNGPFLQEELAIAASFDGFADSDTPEQISRVLRLTLEVQRRALYPDGLHWVGGFAHLTTVKPDGVDQRIMDRWPDDRVGHAIEPSRIDWEQFRASIGLKAGMASDEREALLTMLAEVNDLAARVAASGNA